VEALAKLIGDHASEEYLRSTPETCIVLRYPAWEVVELNPLHEKDFHVAQAALQDCMALSAEEQQTWDLAYRRLFFCRERRGETRVVADCLPYRLLVFLDCNSSR
jgi:hypothetical protein